MPFAATGVPGDGSGVTFAAAEASNVYSAGLGRGGVFDAQFESATPLIKQNPINTARFSIVCLNVTPRVRYAGSYFPSQS
ncbi:MAG TPA: hypothetical protein VGZ02_09660 [Candidatus Baltobacteraceae bacterium]|nr:hypothetical protein [Candidatus Baltobacteraceae bacterium]